jgi:hypothetical protein
MTVAQRRPWTPERDKELQELVFSAISAEAIAEALNRTTCGTSQASILRLPLGKISRQDRFDPTAGRAGVEGEGEIDIG